jgi:hypothetical protein
MAFALWMRGKRKCGMVATTIREGETRIVAATMPMKAL